MFREGLVYTRNQLSYLLNQMELVGLAVEVGTHRGEFADIFMKGWKGRRLNCVDPWCVPVGYEPQAKYLHGKGSHFLAANEVKMKYGPRMSLVQGTSAQSLQHFGDGTLDFVYIDGDHRYEHVVFDLVEWGKKLKVGGVLAGHDWLCPGEVDGGWGRAVQRAVADVVRGDVYLLTEEKGLPWSFYTVKT